MQEDFNFHLHGYEQYCKCCKSYYHGEKIPYSTKDSELHYKISNQLEHLQKTYDINYDSRKQTSKNKWLDILVKTASENFEFTLIEAVVQGIDPFLLHDRKKDYFDFIKIFENFMINSLKGLSNEQKSLFPIGMLKELNNEKYLFLLREVCMPNNGIDKSYSDINGMIIKDRIDSEPLIDLSRVQRNYISCNFCGNCQNCLVYGKNIKFFLNILVSETSYDKYSTMVDILPFKISTVKSIALNKVAISLLEKLESKSIKLDDIAYHKIYLRNILYLIRSNDSLPARFERIDMIQQYLFLFKSNMYNLINKSLTNQVSVIEKELYAKSISRDLSPFRYLPLGEVMGEWEDFRMHISDNNFSLEDLIELVLDLGPRILALSSLIENILKDKNDELLPLVEEINGSIKNDNFLIAQAGVATVIGLIRDKRCQKFIKNISKGHNEKIYLEIINKIENDSNLALNLILPFLHTNDIISDDRSTSLSRHGTVHDGMEYYSQFNALGLLLIQSRLIMGLYSDIDKLNFKIFKPSNEW